MGLGAGIRDDLERLQGRLDAEMRIAGDLEAALRLVATELATPLGAFAQAQLRAYVLGELKRLRGQ
jgi:hypothetical protein